jgi:hypothetical protein
VRWLFHEQCEPLFFRLGGVGIVREEKIMVGARVCFSLVLSFAQAKETNKKICL